ncbi:nose resistant to fluoxetine protein 6-like [Choristoneura fumiferana]|uniref:nose resistant to fluoxetine protein 6-like n=1 Tax=Choristoneura fumiferana TaxID=7141 RepID=UPI003D156A0B
MFLRNIVILFFSVTTYANELVKVPEVDNVISSLSSQQWDDDEAACRGKILNVLHNVKNSTLWASWIWNANPQAPLGTFFGNRYHLGNYDQCLRPPWLSEHPELRSQYCLADVEMSKDPAKKNWDLPGPYEKAELYYVDSGTDFGRSFSYMAYGVCLPSGCQTKSVQKFVKALLSVQHLQAAWDADVKIHHCEEAGAPHVPRTGYYAYMYTFTALAFMAVASTYYISEYPVTANANTFVNHVAKSFCLRRNWDTVFKDDKDALTSMHGIRFLTAIIIIYIHTVAFVNGTSVTNALDFENIGQKFYSAFPVVHFDVFVDTFFAMAALLLGKSIATLDVSKPSVILKQIAKRYIRLLGPFAVTVFFMGFVLMEMDSGPIYLKTAKTEQEACEKTWWLALLMVGNYFHTDAMCHPATWYIPCDFHFYLITLVLLYVYRKDPKVGKIAAAVVVFLGFIGPGINAYIYNLPAVMTFNLGVEINIRNSNSFINGYIRTHNRMGPYVVGLIVGYMMSIYKPADYKKVWSKTTSFLGAGVGLLLMGVVLGTGVFCYTYRVMGPLAWLYLVFDRTTFAVAVLIVIVFCTYGDVPLINSFLSWAPFKPLSRLSYGVYVIHLVLLYRSKTSLRAPLRYHYFDVVVEAAGLAVTSLILSLTVWLLVEAPLINFTNKYLDTRSKEKVNGTQNGVEITNNTNKHKVN